MEQYRGSVERALNEVGERGEADFERLWKQGVK
jgi:hypothetical protein